jgi:hypothetical protein
MKIKKDRLYLGVRYPNLLETEYELPNHKFYGVHALIFGRVARKYANGIVASHA